jgi:hypothetical protein
MYINSLYVQPFRLESIDIKYRIKTMFGILKQNELLDLTRFMPNQTTKSCIIAL